MKATHQNPLPPTRFSVSRNLIEHRFQGHTHLVKAVVYRAHSTKPVGYFAQLMLNNRQSTRNVVASPRGRFARLRRTAAREHRRKVTSVQVKRKGQRLKRAVAAAS